MRAALPQRLGLLAILVAAACVLGLLFRGGAEPISAPEGREAPGAPGAAPPPAAAVEAPGLLASNDGAEAARAGPETAIAVGGARAAEAQAAVPEETCDPLGPFCGRCVDPTGRGVANALVEVVSGREGARGLATPIPSVTSGPDGGFRLVTGEGVLELRVRAGAPGLLARRPDEPLVRGVVARIVLVPAVELRVRVLEHEGGGALGGAQVALLAGEASARRADVDFIGRPPRATAKTDESGWACLEGPDGAGALLVRRPPWAPRLVQPLLVAPPGLELVVVLERGESIQGRVVDPEDQPVAGARVVASTRLGWTADVVTNAKGLFVLEGVPPLGEEGATAENEVRVAVLAEGYPWTLEGFERPVGADGAPWLVQLLRGGPVEGQLLTGNSQHSIVSVRASVHEGRWPDGLAPPAAPEAVAVGTDGRFRFSAIPVLPVDFEYFDAQGRRVEANWSYEGFGHGGASISAPPPAAASSAREQAVTRLRVRLVGARGEGVPNAPIAVGFGRDQVLHLLGRGRTDGEGWASFEGIAPGTHSLVVDPPAAPSFCLPITVGSEETEERTILLPRGVLEGRVRFLDGGPAAIPLVVRLTLGPEGAGRTVLGGYVVRADAEGFFRCEGLGENEYLVEPEAPYQAVPRPLPVSPGARLDLVAVTAAQEPGLRVEVVFEAREDAPGAGPAVTLRFASRSGGPTIARGLVATTRPGGYVTESAVPAGEYEVWLARAGREDRSLGILRVEGGEQPARLTVSAAR